MAAPHETITLHPENVLFETYVDTYIYGLGDVSVGRALLVGINVKDWVVEDIFLYDRNYSYQFRARDRTYSVIHTDRILLKYIPEEPLQKQF